MIADLKPYPTYKNSGVPWLGDVPEHWEVRTLRRGIAFLTDFEANGSFANLKAHVFVAGNDGYAWYVRSTDLANNRVDRDPGNNFCNESTYRYLTKTRLTGGELLVTKRGEIGKVYVMPIPAVPATLGPNQYLIRLNGLLDPVYAFQFMRSAGQTQLKALDKSTTIGALYKDDIKDYVLPFPPLNEQAAIVHFLNHVDRRIRRYVRGKQKLIKLLQEQKQAIIHRAVTRGLDPNVRLKPSGVEWLGYVPEHWDIRPAKYFYREVDDRSETGTEELLSVSHITGVTPRSQKNITMFMALSYIGHKVCKPDDLVINTMWAWMAALGIARQSGIVSPSYAVYRPLRATALLGEYADLLLRTRPYVSEYVCRSTGIRSSRLRLYPEQFLRIWIVCPPVDEQRTILERLSVETEDIEQAIGNAQREIELFREYRTRLIADVVTGKLDVREVAARLPDEAKEPEPLDEADALSDAEVGAAEDLDTVPEEVEE